MTSTYVLIAQNKYSLSTNKKMIAKINYKVNENKQLFCMALLRTSIAGKLTIIKLFSTDVQLE